MKKTYLLIPLILSLCSCANTPSFSSVDQSSLASSSEISSKDSFLSSSVYSSSKSSQSGTPSLNLQTWVQQLYLADNYQKATEYADGTKELSRPNSLQIYLSGGDTYEVKIFELNNSKRVVDNYTVSVTGEIYEATNFKLNTFYKYEVKSYKDGEVTKSISSRIFKTCGYYRNIYVSGVTNMRDIGGFVTEEGKTVKQGLVYRSGSWTNGATPRITEEGIFTVQNQLKIKSEIDLRNIDGGETGGQTKSAVPTVDYYGFQMEDCYDWREKTFKSLRDTFELMSNEEAYPIDFHCAVGADRTGLVAFFIEGILGADTDRLYRDYMFTNFGKIDGNRSHLAIDQYLKRVKKSGSTTQERTINYLINEVGVTAEQIDAIREIMLED